MPLDLANASDRATIYATANALNADLLAVEDVARFTSAVVQLYGTFEGTVNFQGSLEFTPTNWISLRAVNASTGVAGPDATTAGIYHVPLACKWLRIRVTAFVSGPVLGATMFRTNDVPVIVG